MIGTDLALLHASVNVLHRSGAVVTALRGTQVHVALQTAQLSPVNVVDKVLNIDDNLYY